MPPLLETAMNCEHFKALPFSGGIQEQPAGLMSKMRQVINIYNAFIQQRDHGNKPGETANWRKEHETAWNIISDINELREKHGR